MPYRRTVPDLFSPSGNLKDVEDELPFDLPAGASEGMQRVFPEKGVRLLVPVWWLLHMLCLCARQYALLLLFL